MLKPSGFLTVVQPTLGSRIQGAYNSGKPGNFREFVNSGKFWGKLREFKIYSGKMMLSQMVTCVTV